MVIALFLLSAVAGYLLLGILFAVVFVLVGVEKVDATAHGSSPGFRLIIIPGAVLFWPILLQKWLKASKKKNHD